MTGEVTVNWRRLKQLREARELTQGQLAMKSGVGQSHISRLEAGKRPNAKIGTVGKLAAALGVSVDYLLVQPMSPKPEDLPDFHMYVSRKFAGNKRLQRSLIQVYEAMRSVEEERDALRREREAREEEMEEIRKRRKKGEEEEK